MDWDSFSKAYCALDGLPAVDLSDLENSSVSESDISSQVTRTPQPLMLSSWNQVQNDSHKILRKRYDSDFWFSARKTTFTLQKLR